MCFSPSASFTASALLGVIGVATVAKTKNKKALPLAVIPLIFALQQLIEGGLWLNILGSGRFTLLLTAFFLFFALFWWPAFVPFTVYVIETVPWRRRVLAVLSGVGVATGIYIYATYLLNPTSAVIMNHCIYYEHTTPYGMVGAVLYMCVTVGAGVISSRYMIKFLYTLLAVLAFIAWRIYLANFVSVWCFFAAVASGFIYYIQTSSRVKKKS